MIRKLQTSDLVLILVTRLCLQRSLTGFGATCFWCYFCLIPSLSVSYSLVSGLLSASSRGQIAFRWTTNHRGTLRVAVGLAGQDAADVLDHVDVQVPLRRREHPMSLQS